jgi:urease accessory protein
MTVHVTELLGHVDDPRFRGRVVVAVPIAWDEAARRRLRRRASDGTDLTIDLDRPVYLADGSVLALQDERLYVVHRTPEPALVVRLDLTLPPQLLAEQALTLGHALGNQHIPVDIDSGEVRAPLTTSECVARRTVEALALEGASWSVGEVALGRAQPLRIGHAHPR